MGEGGRMAGVCVCSVAVIRGGVGRTLYGYEDQLWEKLPK